MGCFVIFCISIGFKKQERRKKWLILGRYKESAEKYKEAAKLIEGAAQNMKDYFKGSGSIAFEETAEAICFHSPNIHPHYRRWGTGTHQVNTGETLNKLQRFPVLTNLPQSEIVYLYNEDTERYEISVYR